MDLTSEQVATIVAWGELTEIVKEIILFGSRAKGTSRQDSDVDLALTLTHANPWPAFLANGEQWQNDLRASTGLNVNLESLDGPEADKIRLYVGECSRILFTR